MILTKKLQMISHEKHLEVYHIIWSSRGEISSILQPKEDKKIEVDLHELQCCMEQHTANRKYHVEEVKCTKTLLKALSHCVYNANQCKEDAWHI
jgi:hypothetical protein